MKPPPIKFVVDTREQAPFTFEGTGIDVVRRKLDAGDYGIEMASGVLAPVAIERKSWNDLWGSMSGGRSRFERCVQRLAKLDRAAIVIECSLTKACERPQQIQRVTVASVIGGLISYSAQHAIPIYFCDHRIYAERVTVRFLLSWLKHRSSLSVEASSAISAEASARSEPPATEQIGGKALV